MAVVNAQRWRLVMPSFYFGSDNVGMASWWDWFLVLGFGEGKGREIEKKEERQGSAFWRKKKAGFVFIGFWKRFFLRLLLLLLLFFVFRFFFFFKILYWRGKLWGFQRWFCTLTNMQYVVFCASVNAEGPEAYQICHLLLVVQIGASF